jgi:hypothetical protein
VEIMGSLGKMGNGESERKLGSPVDDGTADVFNLDSDSSSHTSLSHDGECDWRKLILQQMQLRDEKQKTPFEDIAKANPVLPMDDAGYDEGFLNRRLQEVQKRLLAHKRFARLLVFLCVWYVA